MSGLPELHWYGPTNPRHTVVFVHGFGVRWHSKHLFSDIAESLASSNIRSVLFDLSDYDEDGNSTLLPLTDQQDRLRSVIAKVQEMHPAVDLSIVAHSMGCGVVGTLLLELRLMVNKFIMLAPAVGSPGPTIKAHILEREGAYEDESGGVHFTRKSGATTNFDYRYAKEFGCNFNEIYAKSFPAVEDKLYIFLAEKDKRSIEDQLLFKGHGGYEISGSDHNFKDIYRDRITLKVLEALQD